MASHIQTEYILTWREQDAVSIAKWGGRTLGGVVGAYFGATQGFDLLWPGIDQSYLNSKEMVAKLDHLTGLVGPKALVTLSPHSVSTRLDQASEYVAANSSFFSSQGLRGLEQHIVPIKKEVDHFVADWPDNAYKWYPYLHGGTSGVDFELGAEGRLSLGFGHIKPARGDEFYLGDSLTSLNNIIAGSRKKYSAEVKQVEDAMSTAMLGGGGLGGSAGLALGAVLGGVVAYKGLEKAIKAIRSR